MNSYLLWSDYLIETQDTAHALSVLKEGYSITSSEKLLQRIDSIEKDDEIEKILQ